MIGNGVLPPNHWNVTKLIFLTVLISPLVLWHKKEAINAYNQFHIAGGILIFHVCGGRITARLFVRELGSHLVKCHKFINPFN
jgi:cytochrome b561